MWLTYYKRPKTSKVSLRIIPKQYTWYNYLNYHHSFDTRDTVIASNSINP